MNPPPRPSLRLRFEGRVDRLAVRLIDRRHMRLAVALWRLFGMI